MHNPYNNSRYVDRNKAETDLAQNIKKATSPEETAPKQKHVRSCIVFTWDFKSSRSFWNCMQVQPILADEVQCFKALITIHKVINGGHPNTLKEALSEKNWIASLGRVGGYTTSNFGYGSLIKTYVEYILDKLSFHSQFPEFNGNFDYEEYTSLKNTDNPDDGYIIISSLLDLQDKQDVFRKFVFKGFHGSPMNECKISCLVPIVEESYNIYKFCESMLKALHKKTEFVEILEPLRQTFKRQHHVLRQFYHNCSQIRYLTSLMTIPQLPQDASDFVPQNQIVRNVPPPLPSTSDYNVNVYEEQQRELVIRQQETRREEITYQKQIETRRVQQQREYEEQMRIQKQREMQQREMMLQDQMQQRAQGKLIELERDAFNLKSQHERDQLVLMDYERKMKSLEDQLHHISLGTQQRDVDKENFISSLKEEINVWKSKYESLAKLYSKLREEHMQLIKKYKQLSERESRAEEALSATHGMQMQLRMKDEELMLAKEENDKTRGEITRLKNSQIYELDRLNAELKSSYKKISDIENNKSNELSNIQRKLEIEKQNIQELLNDKNNQLREMILAYDELKREIEYLRESKDEETAVLQAGLDQALEALKEAQDNSSESEGSLQKRLASMTMRHSSELNSILDNVLRSCAEKVAQSLFELESSTHQGNQAATAQQALSIIESIHSASFEYRNSWEKQLEGKTNYSAVISSTINFQVFMNSFVYETIGLSRSATDETSENLIFYASKVGYSAQESFENVVSTNLLLIKFNERMDVIQNNHERVVNCLNEVTPFIETLLNVDTKAKDELNAANIGDAVEQAMSDAAKIIEKASQKILNLINEPSDLEISNVDKQVHSAILESVMALTNAISHLIKCATISQREIVSQGKGFDSYNAFYKKNNRWTEGLISASKAVAIATNLLVEAADGAVHGTHSLEQLIVASNEVSAATVQVVAASRVKADLYSKIQQNLELAAKAVTEASRNLVKSVKAIVANKAKSKENKIDFEQIAPHEFKVMEMEQQVKILKLESELSANRIKLAEMRKYSYHEE